MTAHTHGGARSHMENPSMLDLVHLARRPLFPPGGVALCRQIALLTGMKPGDEVLVVPSGLAVTLEHFVKEYDVQGSGVEDDLALLDRAEDRLRGLGLLDRVHMQPGEMDGLPFRDGIFDVVIGELGLTAHASARDVVSEIARVAKPGASVVLVQPVWKAPVDSVRRHVLSEYLGCPPLMMVEWKRFLLGAGVGDLHTEDWSDEGTAFRPQITKPFPDFAELFTFPEKVAIYGRARRKWGWRGVWTAWKREREVHTLLTKERVLGLDLVMGVTNRPREMKGGNGGAGRPNGGTVVGGGGTDAAAEAGGAVEGAEEEQVTGLPLFGGEGRGRR